MKLQTYTYNGIEYTVDYRMSQFRACKGGFNNFGPITFLSWKGTNADKLACDILCKMAKERVLDYSQYKM